MVIILVSVVGDVKPVKTLKCAEVVELREYSVASALIITAELRVTTLIMVITTAVICNNNNNDSLYIISAVMLIATFKSPIRTATEAVRNR